MATRTWFSPMYIGTDADFQAWAQGISTALTALLTKTADTGQIAQPIVAAKPALSGVAGYEIFRFNDAQQATFPIFIKVEYGMSSGANAAALYITTGTGSDGAGAITGARIGRSSFNRGQPGVNGTNYEHGASSGDGYFAMFLGGTDLQASSHHFPLIISRSMDPDGTPSASAYFLLTMASNASNFYTVPPAPLPIVARVTNVSGVGLPVLFTPENTNASEYVSLGGEVPIYPVEPFLGRRLPPLTGLAFVHPTDVGSGVVMQTTLFAQTMSFRRVSNGLSVWSDRGAPALAIRWD